MIDPTEVTDETVLRWVVREFKREKQAWPPAKDHHLSTCSDVMAQARGWDSFDISDDFATLDAEVTCVHGFEERWRYRCLGDLDTLFDEIHAELDPP